MWNIVAVTLVALIALLIARYGADSREAAADRNPFAPPEPAAPSANAAHANVRGNRVGPAGLAAFAQVFRGAGRDTR